MEKKLSLIASKALEEIQLSKTSSELSSLRVKYVGRKGSLTNILKELKNLPVEKRAEVGKFANEIKNSIEKALEGKNRHLKNLETEEKSSKDTIDITLPGKEFQIGRKHLITQILDEIVSIFLRLGFSIEEGPETELDYYNFEALNIPKDHPARDMQDTFYISDEVLLRTHTSPVQIRAYLKSKPPIQIIAQGKVYRRDADISHLPMFHQIEGFHVDEGITFSDLKGTLETFIHSMFGNDVGLRFRPSFFPFTEPSAEVDIACVICKGKGCRVCKSSGWVEILGCGMVDPDVFKRVGYDDEKYTGYAFGMGIERIAMLKYQIDDIRLFFENDLRFLNQF
ncbi:MAG: phenylalanine--tRNA ligase subunit alpha [Candidatus Schekmanbacteria bacterium RIFCSPHIGHO2_02_FULL_38_11]|uniref:Phenylalanine--tRNA ligase alpha subunit n=1 Tax=Candidatus Schekmanbacteria bacterium RIFCSPLOWO2_12_FULL_38_15 TaxID=1817883 RepID=A0A1F7SMU2_9BACT|nr:MAG: phenylalanine--tRNA ligase subunit alpha [Candidatus Schekmanbacteria bacterium RIFCSPHIGHO2_02_FULL_38_11]OGL51093.1 MAG: phenylalanine--tRNA ligase subunit alpha [Candidatus Schekmanbacteria bacterium RIFCSPLOWO2_02_FULL_38_14]OGL55093.1 MAG: phenylalanine--tRNA ligase subunit alpha [Candidatus Schekmanbacteria bacterium RIFCSPLOWO2_12_FULL_38_15]